MATRAPMLDCKRAIENSQGDLGAAKEWLKQKGINDAITNVNKSTTEGRVESYIHIESRIGVLVEVNCQTDFTARTSDFKSLCKNIAIHIAGHSPPPLYISQDQIPSEVVTKEYTALLNKTRREKGIPDIINWEDIPINTQSKIESLAQAKLAKGWRKQICLLDQLFIKDPTGKQTVRELVQEVAGALKENIQVRRFVRFELGEGLTKPTTDFATEVIAKAGLYDPRSRTCI